MDHEKFYAKYPHVIKGSIEVEPHGKVIITGKGDKIESHGAICIIKCLDSEWAPKCLKTRIVNVQDARQVKRCKPCTIAARNMRRRVGR